MTPNDFAQTLPGERIVRIRRDRQWPGPCQRTGKPMPGWQACATLKAMITRAEKQGYHVSELLEYWPGFPRYAKLRSQHAGWLELELVADRWP